MLNELLKDMGELGHVVCGWDTSSWVAISMQRSMGTLQGEREESLNIHDKP